MGRVQWNLQAILETFKNITESAGYYLKQNGSDSEKEFCDSILVADPDIKSVEYLTVLISIVLVFVGLVGNGINISVFVGSLRRHSSSVYNFLLAISDSTFLVVHFLGYHLPFLKCFHFNDSNLDFVNDYEILCEFWCYFMDLFHEYSTALILAFTIERFIAVYKPMRIRQICTLKRTKILCLCLFILIAVWIAPYHFIMIGIFRNACSVLPKWVHGWFMAYTIETFLLRILPVLTIAVLNICIIHKIREKQVVTQENDETRKDQSNQMTIILLLISAGHVILCLPVAFHYLLWMLEHEEILDVSDKGMTIARECVEMLDIAWCTVNFFLYTIGSKMFRQELKKKICPRT